MSLSAIKNSVNFHNHPHQRQIDEVTLCDQKNEGENSEEHYNDVGRHKAMGTSISRIPSVCTVKNIQCFLIGLICFLFLLTMGHLWSLPSNVATKDQFLNEIPQQLIDELKLIRESITKNDYRDPQAVCPNKLYTVVGPPGYWSSCYLIGGAGQLDWRSAREFCQEKGGDLLSVESEVESKFIETHLSKATSRIYTYWIGGTDGGREGYWFWAASNQRMNFSHWAYSAPDNKNGNENCLTLTQSGWNDISCATKQTPICESYVPSAKNTVTPHTFQKPSTICPTSSSFEKDGKTMSTTTTWRTTRRQSTTTPATSKPDEAKENSTAASCYLFMENAMSWQAAQEFCEESGGYLASVDSHLENEFLLQKIQEISIKTSHWWIGGNDFEKGEGNWIWTSSKMPVDNGFQDWVANEPGNGYGGQKEDCLQIQKTGSLSPHHWSDGKCGRWKPSICEVPNPSYNGTDPQKFVHDIKDFVSESLCMTDMGNSDCLNGTWTCYTYVRLQATWQQAKDFCAKRDSILACPDTKEKTDMVYEKAKAYESNGYYWLGATDQEDEGKWFWLKNNTAAMVFDRNLAYSSVTLPYRGGDFYDCLRMELKSYRPRMHWNDASCKGWSYFICEKTSCERR